MTSRLREIALWTGAFLGLLSVVAGTAVMFFGYSFLIFRSGSMGPAIPTGSLALAETVPAAELQPGDVVSVVSVNGARITHRLVGSTVRGDVASLILQGDTNTAPDDEIYQVTEAEREIASVPYLGYVITVLLSPAGLIGAGCLSGMVLLMTFGAQPGQPVSTSEGGKHRGQGRRLPSRGRTGAAVAVAGVVVAGLGVTSTSAFFSDTARATTGSFTSLDLPALVAGCQAQGNGNATISFSAAGFPVSTSFTARLNNGTTLPVTSSGNSRTVTITQAQAGPGSQTGILAGLFGFSQDYTVTVSATLPVGVWSEAASRTIQSSQAGRVSGTTGISCT